MASYYLKTDMYYIQFRAGFKRLEDLVFPKIKNKNLKLERDLSLNFYVLKDYRLSVVLSI